MNDSVRKEEPVYGDPWDTVHDGYFSDPETAAPLVEKIRFAARETKPKAIIDLGGGTGFVLSRLSAAGINPSVRLINLDESKTQLHAARANGFLCLPGSADSFSRDDLGHSADRCLFIMRSVLHYFGKDGLRRVLRHLRTRIKPGELFIHQTASFRRRQDADCLNDLYAMMGTKKRYPTVDFMHESLLAEGWNVLDVCPAAPLRLKDCDLMQRYHLDQNSLRLIRDRLSQNHRVPEDVYQETDGGFCAFLHYWIYACTPAEGCTQKGESD